MHQQMTWDIGRIDYHLRGTHEFTKLVDFAVVRVEFDQEDNDALDLAFLVTFQSDHKPHVLATYEIEDGQYYLSSWEGGFAEEDFPATLPRR